MRPLKIGLMSDYTIVNLGDVENVAPRFQMPEGMDVRFPKRQLGCTIGGVGIEKLPPGVRTPFGHTHSQQEELYVVTEGSGRVKIDEEVHDLRTWDIVRVGPNTMRNFEGGPDGITYIAFGAPIAEQNDGEIVPGWWTD
jgi:gentisate 1,2-dioxygenase